MPIDFQPCSDCHSPMACRDVGMCHKDRQDTLRGKSVARVDPFLEGIMNRKKREPIPPQKEMPEIRKLVLNDLFNGIWSLIHDYADNYAEEFVRDTIKLAREMGFPEEEIREEEILKDWRKRRGRFRG